MKKENKIQIATTSNQEIVDTLKTNETIFRSYFEMPLHGIAITSPNKGWIGVNDKLCSMLGYTRSEILKMTWAEMTHPDDLAADEKLFNQVISGKIEHYNLNKRFVKKDKSIIWTNLSVGCVRKDNGQVDYIIALLEDITEHKNLEKDILRKQEEQKIILDSIPAGVFYKDKFSNFISVNQAYANIMGLTKEKMIGKSLFDLYPTDDIAKLQADDTEVINSEKPKANIIHAMKTPKGLLWLKTDKIPYLNNKGEIIGIIGFSIDITAQKIAEDKIKEHNAEMEKMNQFMIGRELKMVELKEEITKLKK